MKRFLVVRAKTRKEIEAYLPDNFEVMFTEPLPDDTLHAVVGGEDVAGWTMDDYVIPRLASGNLVAHEAPTYRDAVEMASAAMN